MDPLAAQRDGMNTRIIYDYSQRQLHTAHKWRMEKNMEEYLIIANNSRVERDAP